MKSYYQARLTLQGGRINGASPAYTVDEVAHALRVAKSKIVITAPSSLGRAVAAAKKVQLTTSDVLLIQGEAEGFKSVQELIQENAGSVPSLAYRLPPRTTNKDLCGYLNFSSGTTGLPKAVSILFPDWLFTQRSR